MNHGTHSGYQAHRRHGEHACEPRMEGERAYHRERRQQRKRDMPAELVPHGTLNGYLNYMCRCTECRTANRENMRRWLDRRREAS